MLFDRGRNQNRVPEREETHRNEGGDSSKPPTKRRNKEKRVPFFPRGPKRHKDALGWKEKPRNQESTPDTIRERKNPSIRQKKRAT